MSAPRWLTHIDALLSGAAGASARPSAFLADVLEDFGERVETNGGVTFCGHLPTEALLGGYPDMVAFPGVAEVACSLCAPLLREDLESRGVRCERCDAARATQLHPADVGAEPGQVLLLLAIALCEPCATVEGLRHGSSTPELAP